MGTQTKLRGTKSRHKTINAMKRLSLSSMKCQPNLKFSYIKVLNTLTSILVNVGDDDDNDGDDDKYIKVRVKVYFL